jgi:hypothetical protein
MRFSPTRTLLTVGIATMGLVMAAGPAMAHPGGDGDSHRGNRGRHVFRDTVERPGARCHYHATKPSSDAVAEDAVPELVGVSARAPKVAAKNRTKGIDRQRVGWRIVLQEKLGEGDWTAVKRSPVQLRRTTDFKAANFSRIKMRYDGNPDADYRVKTKAFWFNKGLRRIGVASHLVEYYAVRAEVTEGSCPGSIPAPEAP